jgi:hypothetical protein
VNEIKNTFHKYFNDISFNEESHTYRKNNEDFISVTSLLHHYSQPFDSDKIASKTAKSRGVSKESLLKEWKEKGDTSAKKGTYIHKTIENYLSNKKEINTNLYSTEINQFINFYNDFLNNKEIIYLEKVLYNEHYKIAGTIDCLVYDSKENMLYYIDWKTNEKFTISNKYQKLKKPLNKYEQSNKEVYGLQLSFYRYIVEETVLQNETLKNMKDKCKNIVVQFSELNNNYMIHELPYYKYSVVQVLDHYNKK